MLVLSLQPERAALPAGAAQTFDILLKATAPAAPPEGTRKRTPLNLAIVIDNSGSMSGEKIVQAREAAAMVIERLTPGDHLAVVTFESQVQVVIPAGPVTDTKAAAARVRSIRTAGQTALHAGWLEGATQAARFAAPGIISHVVVLTDGAANVGITDQQGICADVVRMAAAGVTTTTCGFGRDFVETLLQAMADAGRGKCYFAERPQDLLDRFEEEFELLRDMCARRLRLRIVPRPGVAISVSNLAAPDAHGLWSLPDVAYGASAWAMLRVQPPCGLVAGSQLDLFHAELVFQDGEGASLTAAPVVMTLPVVLAEAAQALPADPEVVACAIEVRIADFKERIAVATRDHDWDAARALLAQARHEASGNPWALATLEAIGEHVESMDSLLASKEAFYSARAAKLRLSDSEDLGDVLMTRESAKKRYLRRKIAEGRDSSGES